MGVRLRMYETEIWQQQMARGAIRDNASLSSLVSLLVEKEIISLEELESRRDEALKMEPYASNLKQIDENIAQYKKWEADPNRGLGDLFASFFGSNKQD